MQIMTEKALADDLKDNGIEQWVTISIMLLPCKPDGSPDYLEKKEILHIYDLPREVYERRRWVAEWRHAYWTCRYPKRTIFKYHSYYDKKTNIPIGNSVISLWISAKRKVTEIENKITRARNEFQPTLFCPRFEDRPDYGKALDKLNDYKSKVFTYGQEIELIKQKNNLP